MARQMRPFPNISDCCVSVPRSSHIESASLLVCQKLRPVDGLQPSSPRCNMVPNPVRLRYWWHLRLPADDPDHQAGAPRDCAGIFDQLLDLELTDVPQAHPFPPIAA